MNQSGFITRILRDRHDEVPSRGMTTNISNRRWQARILDTLRGRTAMHEDRLRDAVIQSFLTGDGYPVRWHLDYDNALAGLRRKNLVVRQGRRYRRWDAIVLTAGEQERLALLLADLDLWDDEYNADPDNEEAADEREDILVRVQELVGWGEYLPVCADDVRERAEAILSGTPLPEPPMFMQKRPKLKLAM